jgi:tetratricopeptide (TPR) repeat protein
MEDVERLLQRGREHFARGSHALAVEAFRQALTEDPDNSEGHALLALTLHALRRLAAAEVEAGRALTLDPESSFAHLAMARVLVGARRFEAARAHTETAVSLEHDSAFVLTTAASVRFAMAEYEAAHEWAVRAREIEPDDAGVLALLGSIAYARGDYPSAGQFAVSALSLEPDNVDALVLQGLLLLRRGAVNEAREHALAALREEPNDRDALSLLVAVKARSSLTLGLWWRINTFLWQGKTSRAIVLLIGMFLTTNAARMLLDDYGLHRASELVGYFWLALCLYSWVGPARFQAALEKELAPVHLDPRF